MRIIDIKEDGIADFYKFVAKIKSNPELTNMIFGVHLPDLTNMIHIKMVLEDINILEAIALKRMYNSNAILSNFNRKIRSTEFEDDDYKTLFQLVNYDNNEYPLFSYCCNCNLTITGQPVLQFLTSEYSFDPSYLLIKASSNACIEKDGMLNPNIVKYKTEIYSLIKNIFVQKLYKYILQFVSEIDYLSDVGIENFFLSNKRGVTLKKVITKNQIIYLDDSQFKSKLEEEIKYKKLQTSNETTKKDILSNTYLVFDICDTIKSLFFAYYIFPSHCIAVSSSFYNLFWIFKNTHSGDYIQTVLKLYNFNMMRKVVCLPINTECKFQLKLSFLDVINYLKPEIDSLKDEFYIFHKIFVYSNSIYNLF